MTKTRVYETPLEWRQKSGLTWHWYEGCWLWVSDRRAAPPVPGVQPHVSQDQQSTPADKRDSWFWSTAEKLNLFHEKYRHTPDELLNPSSPRSSLAFLSALWRGRVKSVICACLREDLYNPPECCLSFQFHPDRKNFYCTVAMWRNIHHKRPEVTQSQTNHFTVINAYLKRGNSYSFVKLNIIFFTLS